MKRKFLAAGLACSVTVNIFLAINIKRCLPECERIHTDDINYALDVIPDENAAIKIARLKLSRELMGNFGLEDSFEYNIEVMYDQERNEWCVSFKNKNINYLDSSATIWLSRSYGVMNDFRR